MADKDVNLSDIVVNGISLTTEQAEKNKAILKSALMAQARRELERVLKLTDLLDKVQEKYQERVFDYIENHNDESAINYLPRMIEVISQCLDRSQKLIHDIALDEKFNITLIDASTTVNNTNIEAVNGLDLSSALERNHVREAVNSILDILKSEQDKEQNVIDVTNNDNNDTE